MSDAAVLEAFRNGTIADAIMVEIDHPEGFGRFWSGSGNFDFEGNVYTGFAAIGSVSENVSSTEIEIIEQSLALSGVDADLVEGLDDSVKGRFVEVHELLLDDDYRVLNRELQVRAKMDYQVFAVGDDGKATITIKAHAGLFWLQNRSAAKWSPEEAKAVYPDETGFDEMHTAEDKQDSWRPA